MSKHRAPNTFLTNITSPAFRMWAYTLCCAVCAFLAVAGFIREDFVMALNTVFAALFAIAASNTEGIKNDTIDK